AKERIVECHACAADERTIGLVEGLGARDLVDEPQLEVILQVIADASLVEHDRDAEVLQLARAADAGELEDLDRADRTGRENHLAAGARGPARAPLPPPPPPPARARGTAPVHPDPDLR